jgi:hypothetical protein
MAAMMCRSDNRGGDAGAGAQRFQPVRAQVVSGNGTMTQQHGMRRQHRTVLPLPRNRTTRRYGRQRKRTNRQRCKRSCEEQFTLACAMLCQPRYGLWEMGVWCRWRGAAAVDSMVAAWWACALAAAKPDAT